MDDLSFLDKYAQPKPVTTDYDGFIEESASKHGVDPDLIRLQMGTESAFKPKARSPKGASGLMQLMPGTARNLGVKNIYDPKQNIEGGVKYMRQLLDMFGGDVNLALAGYNAGEGAVQKYGNKIPPYKETQNYVKKIAGSYKGTGYHPSSLSFLDKYADTANDAPVVDDSGLSFLDKYVGDTEDPGTIYGMTDADIKGGATTSPATPHPVSTDPVPETPETLQAQVASTFDANSPKAMTLLTNGNPANNFILSMSDAKRLTRVNTPNGIVLVNVKKLGIKPSQAAEYVKKNGFAKDSGFVIDMGNNTGDGQPAVAAVDPNTGKEVFAAVTPTPESAQAQAQQNQAMFPGTVQVPTDTNEVTAKRTQEDINAEFERWIVANRLPRNNDSVAKFNAMKKAEVDDENEIIKAMNVASDLTDLNIIGEAAKEGKSAKDALARQAEIQKRFETEKAANPALTVEQFNATLAAENEAANAKSKAEWLAKNPKYAQFATAKQLDPHDPKTIEAYNAQLPKGGTRTVTGQRVSRPTSPTAPAQVAPTDAPPQVTPPTENDYQQWREFMKLDDSPESRQQFQMALAVAPKTGSVDVSATVDALPDGQKLSEFEQETETADGGTLRFAREVGDPTDNLSGIVGTYRAPKGVSRKQAAIQAVANVGAKYGLTPQQASEFVNGLEKSGSSFILGKYDEKNGGEIKVDWQTLQNAGLDTKFAQRNEQVQNRLPDSVSNRDFGYTTEAEAAKNLEQRIKEPGYAAQEIASDALGDLLKSPQAAAQKLGWAFGNYWNSDDVPAPSETWVKSEKDRLLKQYGDLSKAWTAEQTYQNADGLEKAIRFANQTSRSFVKNLVSGTVKSVLFVDNLLEPLGVNAMLPEKAKISIRNAANVADLFVRAMQGDTSTKNWQNSDTDLDKTTLFKSIQEFDKAVGDDPVLKGRLLGAGGDAFGSAMSFVAMAALMPSLKTTNFWGNVRSWDTAIAGALQSAGSGYEEGKNSKLTETQAKIYGGIQGLLGTTEALGAGAELAHLLKNDGMKTIRAKLAEGILEVARHGYKEGKQEFGQEVFQTTSGKIALEYLKDNDPSLIQKLTNVLDRLPKQFRDTVTNEGLIALVTGGTMGAGTKAATTSISKDLDSDGQGDTKNKGTANIPIANADLQSNKETQQTSAVEPKTEPETDLLLNKKAEKPKVTLEPVEDIAKSDIPAKGISDIVQNIPDGTKGKGALTQVADILATTDDPIKTLNAIQRGRTRIENMPASDHTSQITQRLDELDRQLTEQGYETEDLLGKPFDNGLNVEATFVEDPSVPFGEERITEIKRPQIMKDGKMVQNAQVLVGKNYDESSETSEARDARIEKEKAKEEKRQQLKQELLDEKPIDISPVRERAKAKAAEKFGVKGEAVDEKVDAPTATDNVRKSYATENTELEEIHPNANKLDEFSRSVRLTEKEVEKHVSSATIKKNSKGKFETSVWPGKTFDSKEDAVNAIRESASHIMRVPRFLPEDYVDFLDDPDRSIRQRVVDSPQATEEALIKALNDPIPEIRNRALYNPNATKEVFRLARENDIKDVRLTAKREGAKRFAPSAQPKAEAVKEPQSAVDRIKSEAASIANAVSDRKANITKHYQYDFKVKFLRKHGLPETLIDDTNFQKAFGAGVLENELGGSLGDIDPKLIPQVLANPEPFIEAYRNNKVVQEVAGKPYTAGDEKRVARSLRADYAKVARTAKLATRRAERATNLEAAKAKVAKRVADRKEAVEARRDGKALRSIVQNELDQYLYHGTGEGAFRRIREEGLTPQAEGKYLYFADRESYADTYAERKGNSFGNRVLRVKFDKNFTHDESTGLKGDYKTLAKIPASNLEVKDGGKWIPLEQYSNEEIGIMPLADSALRSIPETDPLQGIITDRGIDYERATTVAREVLSGKQEIRRLSPEGEQGRIAGGSRNVESTIILAGNEAASEAAGSRTHPVKRQERALEEYARHEGIWIDPKEFNSDRQGFISKGVEAYVHRSDDGNSVVKLIDYKMIDRHATPLDFIDHRISAFNHLFPGTPYELVGFTRIKDDFRFVVKQRLIRDAVYTKPTERQTYMQGKGLTMTDKYGEAFANDLYKVSDLHEKNALRGVDGTIYVIDAVPKAKHVSEFEVVPTDAALRSVSGQTDPFYSRVESVIADKLPAKATPQQVTALLAKNSVKELDPEFIALKIWLDDQGQSVSKADVLDFVNSNKVEVQEVVKTSDQFTLEDAENEAWDKLKDGGIYVLDDGSFIDRTESGGWFVLHHDGGNTKYSDLETALDDAVEKGLLDITEKSETKFAQWQLPGESENYREEFLTAPDTAANFTIEQNKDGYWEAKDADGKPFSTVLGNKYLSEGQAKQEFERKLGLSENSNWKDGHQDYADVKNPIARIRYNDRTTTDGDKMLFAEEFQQPSKENIAKMPKVYQKYGEQMAIRKMLYRAVEGGYDYFGFTTGQQQADRYDLSKHVKQIRTKAWSGGNRKVEIVPIKGDDIEIEVTPDGKVVEGYKEFIGKNLDEVVGKDLAPQILEAPSDGYKVFSGLDLKIGGTGLINRYDRKHVDYINKLMKPYGVSVEAKDISTLDPEAGFDDGSEKETIHAVRISPEFRKAVEASIREHGGAFPLFKVAEPADIADIEALGKGDFKELFNDIKSDVKSDANGANILDLGTNKTIELVRTAFAYMYDTPLEGTAIPGGMYLDPSQTNDFRDALQGIADAASEAGIESKGVDTLIKNLDKAAKDGDVRVIGFQNTLKHETGHQQSNRGAVEKSIAKRRTGLRELADGKDAMSQSFRTAFAKWNDLENRNWKVENATPSQLGQAAEEIAMYIADGQHTRLGLSYAKAIKLGVELQLRYAEARIQENPELTVREALATFEGTILQPFSEQVYEREQPSKSNQSNVESKGTGRENDQGDNAGNTQSDGVGVSQEPASEQKAKDLSNRRPGKSGLPFDEKEAREADAKGRKVAAISRIIGVEIYYDPQTNAETAVKAEQVTGRVGVQKAIADALTGKPSAEGMKVVYNEFSRLNALYDHFNDNGQEAEAIAIATELADLANAIQERQLATGQEAQIARTFDVLSPDIALLMAQRRIINKRGEGAKLTPEETAATIDAAKQLSKIEAQLEETRRKLRNSEAARRRLESDKEPRKRAATSQEKLLKEYQEQKTDLFAQLEKLFPDSPLFNGKAQALRMVAWHGSPHTFDKFDISKIGTGEGAQAYGHGLYFTDKEAVAQHYKDALERRVPVTLKINGTELTEANSLSDYRDAFGESAEGYDTQYFRAMIEAIENDKLDDVKIIDRKLHAHVQDLLRNNNVEVIKPRGAKYRVDLKPEQDEYLLWDKPFSQQSEKVQKALMNKVVYSSDIRTYKESQEELDYLDKHGKLDTPEWDKHVERLRELRKEYPLTEIFAEDKEGDEIYEAIANDEDSDKREAWVEQRDWLIRNKGASHPETLAHLADNPRADKLASEKLKSLGIRGIKYLDGTSRGKGEGSYNYVIFDDADVEIQEVLRSIAAEPLDPLKQEVLTKWATGQILEGLPYEALIKTLEQFGISQAEAQQIHSDAVDVIKPAREPRTAEAKEKTQIRNEHYKQAKAFASDGKPQLSGIAQDAQEDAKYKDDPKLIEVIDYLTNVNTAKAGRSLNSLINGIREANPEMSISQAEQLAGRAQQAVNDLRLKRKRAADKAKNISEDARQEINRLTVEKRRASRRMSDHLKQLGRGTEWAMHRFNNLMRAAFVNNYVTQLFNAVQSTAVATPTQMALDGITQMMLRAGVNIGENTKINLKDIMLPEAYIFANNKQLAEQALAQFPEEYFRIHAGILGDIEIDKVAQADTAHWLTKPLHKVLDKADKATDVLSRVALSKVQEIHFRNAIIASRFDQLIRAKSKGKETLESALKNGEFTNLVTEKDATRIADDALEVTFASEITDPIGKTLKKGYDVLDNFVPIFLNPVTYARFTYTTTKVMVANPLLFGAMDAKAAGGRGYNTKSVAKGVLAWGGVAVAYALTSALGGDDDRWDTLYIFGKDQPPLSIKRFFPLSAYFYVAHLIRQYKEGGTPPTMEDLLEGFASLETEYYNYGPGLGLAGAMKRAMYDGTGSKEDVGRAGARMLGNFFSGLLSVLKPAKLALSAIDDEEATLRDDSDTAKEKFISELSRSVPGIIRLSDAPKKIDPVTDKPILQPWILGRAVGLNFVHPSFLSNKDSAATQWANRLFAYEGGSSQMSAEDRNAYFIKKRLKEAMRRGEIDLTTANEKAQKYLAKVLTPESMNRLQKELEMSELQSKIKAGFSQPDDPKKAAKEVRDLRTVWSKATDQEKDDIRKVLANKQNLSPEFIEEFNVVTTKQAKLNNLPDNLRATFEKLDIKPPGVGDTLTPTKGGEKVKLTPEQKAKYEAEVIERIDKKVESLQSKPAYQNADDALRKKMVEGIVRKQRAEEATETKKEMTKQKFTDLGWQSDSIIPRMSSVYAPQLRGGELNKWQGQRPSENILDVRGRNAKLMYDANDAESVVEVFEQGSTRQERKEVLLPILKERMRMALTKKDRQTYINAILKFKQSERQAHALEKQGVRVEY